MSLSRDLVRELGHDFRGVARLLRGLLVGVAPLETSLVPSAAALVGVAGLAAWLPARRAAEIDPAAVLRQE